MSVLLKQANSNDKIIAEIRHLLKKFPASINEEFTSEYLEAYGEEEGFLETLLELANNETVADNLHNLEKLLVKKEDKFFAGHFLEMLITAPNDWSFYYQFPSVSESKKTQKTLKKHFEAISKIILSNENVYDGAIILGGKPIIPLLREIQEESCARLDSSCIHDTIRVPRKKNDSKADINFTSNILAYIADSYLKNPCYEIIANCLYARFGDRCDGITSDHVRKNYNSTYTAEWKELLNRIYIQEA